MSHPQGIALIEDHERLRVATAQLLRTQGHQAYELEFAGDKDALVGGDLVHLYLMDLNLPSEDGLHLAQRVRQTHPQARLIMPTARGGAGHMSAGFQSGTCPRPKRVGCRHLLGSLIGACSRWGQRSHGPVPAGGDLLPRRCLVGGLSPGRSGLATGTCWVA